MSRARAASWLGPAVCVLLPALWGCGPEQASLTILSDAEERTTYLELLEGGHLAYLETPDSVFQVGLQQRLEGSFSQSDFASLTLEIRIDIPGDAERLVRVPPSFVEDDDDGYWYSQPLQYGVGRVGDGYREVDGCAVGAQLLDAATGEVVLESAVEGLRLCHRPRCFEG